MVFDWRGFCEQQRIPFVTEGPNTARGHISIRCPMCGSSDPSEHMGLSLDREAPYWGCFRNGRHRGKDPVFLIAKLLSCSFEHARQIVRAFGPKLDDFDKVVSRLREEQAAREVPPPSIDLEAPPEFVDLCTSPSIYAERFLDYLARRGYGNRRQFLREVASIYRLWYALTGPYAHRIIFPIYGVEGLLIGWTGRDIRPGARQRYLTSEGLPPSALLTFDGLESASAVVLCEGPFDAMWVDWHGRGVGISSIALLSSAFGEAKLSALRAMKKKFFVLLDSDAALPSLILSEELGCAALPLPPGRKDPAEMDSREVSDLVSSLK